MYEIEKTEIKLGEAFNEMPGGDEVRSALQKLLGNNWETVDVEGKDFWENADDTLIFMIDAGDLYRFGAGEIMRVIEGMGAFSRECGADEFQTIHKGSSKLICRFWWD